MDKFPVEIPEGYIFNFTLNRDVYIGYNNNQVNQYAIWRFLDFENAY